MWKSGKLSPVSDVMDFHYELKPIDTHRNIKTLPFFCWWAVDFVSACKSHNNYNAVLLCFSQFESEIESEREREEKARIKNKSKH